MPIDNKVLLENSKDLSILYVEDDESVRDETVKLLENYFKTIDAVADAEAGYLKYKKKFNTQNTPYDIVISDIHLPKMNGIQMCEKIKSLNSEQVIILITAFHEVEYLNDAIELGVNGFLNKPIQLENFKRILYKVTLKIADKKLLQEHYEQLEEFNMLYIDQKDASQFNSAKNILKDLEENKEKISRLWTDKAVVHERLESHYIDVEFFRSHYAIKVIEYFLGVIKGDNKAGNCPVIFIMLDFFKNKNLPLKDIFMVCVLFKNTVSSYIFDKYTFNNALFDDISEILDKNFEGVIINYLALKYEMKNTSYSPKKSQQDTVKVEVPIEKKETAKELVTYREYVLEHDLYELLDLEEEIDNLAISVTESAQVVLDDFFVLGERIKKYGDILTSYPIFIELGRCIVKLGEYFLSNAELLYHEKEKMSSIASLIEGFVNDLIIWRREVFDNNIEDPHFLNQSFFSNVDTIIMLIEYDESASAQEDDLDDMFF